MLVPCRIVGFDKVVDLVLKKAGQCSIFRSQVTLAHDPPGAFSRTIKDEQMPAAIILADLRTSQVNSTVTFRGRLIVPEKRASLGPLGKDARVIEQGDLIRIHGYPGPFTGILVAEQEAVIPIVFLDFMDQAQVAAAFTALAAFK